MEENRYLVKWVTLGLAPLLGVGLPAAELHVSRAGSDSNPGNADAPLRTLAKAAELAQPGDVCFIHEGTYEETLTPRCSGRADAPITFRSVPGAKVVISSLQPLSGWERDEGEVFQTAVAWDLGQDNMVLHRGTLLDIARWPNNSDGDPYSLDAMRNTGGTDKSVRANAYLEYADGIPEFDWSDGGSLAFFGDARGCGWTMWRSAIKQSDPNGVVFDLPSGWVGDYHAPAAGGEFYLQGVRGALDFQNEWHLGSDGFLRVQLPGGGRPEDGTVQMRRRLRGIDLRGRSHITVMDLAVFGGSIDLSEGASDNLISGITSFFGSFTSGVFDDSRSGSQSIFIDGDRNTVERCEIAYGSGTGIYLEGVGNRILNSRIHDFGYLGNYDAPVCMRHGAYSLLKGNTIFRGGRDCIQMFHSDSEIAYNDAFESNLITHDCSMLYTTGGPFRTEIHHNWFHDAYNRGKLYKAAGLYLDSSPEAFHVHHNVVWNTQWSSLHMNWLAKDIMVRNNTFWNGSAVMGWWRPKAGGFKGVNEDMHFENVRVWQNVGYGDQWDPETDQQGNVSFEEDPFVDFAGRDFRLKEPIPGVGAYEPGEDYWRPGIDWNPEQGPAGHGDFGLLGGD